MSELVKQLSELIKIQGEDGNWNYDPYMLGMYNGMELMFATIEGRDPQFREAPEKWLSDGVQCRTCDGTGMELQKPCSDCTPTTRGT